MILSVDFNGYKFFDNSSISFSADLRTKKLLSNSEEIDGKNILKTAGIYGSNNSGKTNIVKIFSLIKCVLDGKENIIFNSQAFGDSKRTDISITFNNFSNNGWLKYHFVYNNETREYEYESITKLTFYDTKKIETIEFEKDNTNKKLFVFGEDKSTFLDIIPSRLPFFYSIELKSGLFSNLKDYFDELRKLSNSIVVLQMYNIPLENTIESLKGSNSSKIDFIKKFVKSADLSIKDFEYDSQMDSFKFSNVNEEALNRFQNVMDIFKLKTTYGKAKVSSFMFDSSGTKKIEAIASHIYDALKEGKTLIVDEIDNGLHYILTRSIVSLFNNLANNKGQLLFITHDLLLINNNKLMRKDQIYFLNRNSKSASLYCLKDAKSYDGGPREVSEIIKRYNRGEFGHVPDPDFIDLLVGEVHFDE